MRLARLELVQSQLTAGFPSQRPALPLRSEPVFRCASSPSQRHGSGRFPWVPPSLGTPWGEVAASLWVPLRAVKRIFEKGGHWAVDAAYVSVAGGDVAP